jgi:hypothetical protein
LFHTGAAVALIITLVLDNTIPGTAEERGLHVWQKLSDESAEEWWEDDHMNAVGGWGACWSAAGRSLACSRRQRFACAAARQPASQLTSQAAGSQPAQHSASSPGASYTARGDGCGVYG